MNLMTPVESRKFFGHLAQPPRHLVFLCSNRRYLLLVVILLQIDGEGPIESLKVGRLGCVKSMGRRDELDKHCHASDPKFIQ